MYYNDLEQFQSFEGSERLEKHCINDFHFTFAIEYAMLA